VAVGENEAIGSEDEAGAGAATFFSMWFAGILLAVSSAAAV